MLTRKEFINKLKSELYDIYSLIYKLPQEQLFEHLCETLKQNFQVEYVGIFLYESVKGDRKLQSFDHDRSLYFTALLTDEFYLNNMKEKLDNDPVLPFESFTNEPLINKNAYVLRLSSEQETHGFLLITNDNNKLDIPLLKQVGKAVNQLFVVINYCLHDQHLQTQTETLLNFSTKIYSLYTIKDILRVVIDKLQSVYPYYSHQLLLSQDYDQDRSLPVEMIEYGDGKEITAGTRAFISGEIEVEYTEDKTTIYTPLSGNQGVYGVIKTIVPALPDAITDEINFLQKFAEIIGQSVERTALYQSSNRLVADLQIINEASHKLNSNLEKWEIIDMVKRQIIDSCYATEVGFIKYEENNGHNYSINAGSTLFFKTEENNHFIKQLCEEVAKRDTSMFYGDFSEVHEAFPFQSVMIIPMKVSDYSAGTTVVMHENSYFFSFEKFKFIESLVQHATLALMNTTLRVELQQSVITDYLTKLYARNYLDTQVSKHMTEDEQGVVILFDIDDFKLINDLYGHSVGDKVLIQIANILKESTPEQGFVARWGGEEFAIYLRHVSLEQGTELANYIRELVEKATDPNVTISAGVAYWSSIEDDSVKDVFIRADQALYQAKAIGKNQVVDELQSNEIS